MSWMYVSTTGEPLSADESELPGLAQHGLLVPSTLVWHPGRPDWVPAAELKPELFSSSASASAGMNLGRAVLEPLWARRGWLLVLAAGMIGVSLLRAGVAAVAAWPDMLRLGGIAASLIIGLVAAGMLARWWRLLKVAQESLGLQEAREAARAGAHVVITCGLIGVLLLLLTAYDIISLLAKAVLKG